MTQDNADIFRATLILGAVVVLCCQPVPGPSPPPSPSADGGAPATDSAPFKHDAGVFTSATCSDACGLLRARSCPEGQSTAGGSTCEVVCKNTASLVPAYKTQVTCVAGTPWGVYFSVLEGIRACGVKCEGGN